MYALPADPLALCDLRQGEILVHRRFIDPSLMRRQKLPVKIVQTTLLQFIFHSLTKITQAFRDVKYYFFTVICSTRLLIYRGGILRQLFTRYVLSAEIFDTDVEIDIALDAGYTVAWGGDVTGDFTRTGLAMLPDGVRPTQEMRQEQWNDWRFTYDHVMLIYGKAVDEQGKPYYIVKNSWGESGQYKGIWYMSRDYMTLNTTYLFLNRHALPNTMWTQR
jgi:hypothetical protein